MNDDSIPAQRDAWGMRPISKDEPWTASYLEDLPDGGLRLLQILYWYDEPIMFLADDRDGAKWWVVKTDEIDTASQYMAVSLTQGEFDGMMSCEDIEGINDMARAAVTNGNSVLFVLEGTNGEPSSQEAASLQDALSSIGIGRDNGRLTTP